LHADRTPADTEQWLPLVRTNFQHSDTLPILVLGLKRDLRSESDPNGIIYPQEAHRIAAEMRADRYMECSAVTGELVFEVFEDICATAIKTVTGDSGGGGGGQSEGGCVAM
jgi:Ras homolog gene family, member A